MACCTLVAEFPGQQPVPPGRQLAESVPEPAYQVDLEMGTPAAPLLEGKVILVVLQLADLVGWRVVTIVGFAKTCFVLLSIEAKSANELDPSR
jgi:hypothetical protein